MTNHIYETLRNHYPEVARLLDYYEVVEQAYFEGLMAMGTIPEQREDSGNTSDMTLTFDQAPHVIDIEKR